MVAVVKQFVTVQAGGLIHFRSKELKAGDQAEVIVRIPQRAKSTNGKHAKSAGRARKPIREVPIARMTKQVRGDIKWAKRVRAEGGPNIPWEQIKAERGL